MLISEIFCRLRSGPDPISGVGISSAFDSTPSPTDAEQGATEIVTSILSSSESRKIGPPHYETRMFLDILMLCSQEYLKYSHRHCQESHHWFQSLPVNYSIYSHG